MLRYFLILPSGEPLAPHVMRIVVVIIACVLFLLTGFACKSIGETRKYYEWINGYIPGYLITVAVCSVYTFFRYSFSVQNLLHAITPFLFVILAYPLIYIFICDDKVLLKINKDDFFKRFDEIEDCIDNAIRSMNYSKINVFYNIEKRREADEKNNLCFAFFADDYFNYRLRC